MKIKIIAILIGILLIGITFLPATGGIKKKINQDIYNKILQSISGISFYQVDYKWTKATYDNSNTGLIVVDIDELNAVTGLNSGYINVYNLEGWVVQNLEIVEDFPYSTVGTYFDLGQTGDVKSTSAYVEYTSDPLFMFEYSGALPPYPVDDTILNAEGGEDFIIAVRPQPPNIDHLPGSGGDYNPIGINTHCTQNKHPNVETANNQCVPAAYANNLQYLEDWYGVNIPHDNIPGLGGTPSNSLVGILDNYMERPFVSRQSGSPTKYNKSILGLLKYAYFNSLQIDIRHQGRKGDQDIEFVDYVSDGQGLTVKFEFIYEEICKGSAVELAMGFYYPTGSRDGGHMVQVVTAGYIYGVPYIYFLDDRVQIASGVPYGDSTGTTGPSIKCDLIDKNINGMYNLVGFPTNFGYPPDVECIYVQQAKNSPPLKPSMPTGGELTMRRNVEYDFYSVTSDPNDDQIWYWFHWGDGFTSGWVGAYDSGVPGTASHSWGQDGVYELKVKAKDFQGAESEWSDIRIGVVPKSNICTVIRNKEILLYFMIGVHQIILN